MTDTEFAAALAEEVRSAIAAERAAHLETLAGLRAELAELRSAIQAIPAGPEGPAGPAGERGPEGTPGRDGRDGQPGRDGERGEKGADGRDGTDGRDGLGLDQLEVEQEGRTVVIRARGAGRELEVGRVTFPTLEYRGVFAQGQEYDAGDCVTWGGSVWHCMAKTGEKPGDGSSAWRLMVKRGRDGKDRTP